jgi:hypothetical protein
MFIVLNIFYNIVILKKDITEKVRLVVLHGLATIDGTHVIMLEQGPKRHVRYSSATTISAQDLHYCSCWSHDVDPRYSRFGN